MAELESILLGLSVLVATIALIVSIRTSAKQREADRRSFIFPLWEHINSVSHLDPKSDKLVAEDARIAINALKLVALCWEGDIVNRRMIALAFGRTYMDLYEELESANFVTPGFSSSWRELVRSEQAVRRVYKAIERMLIGKSQLT